MVAAEQPDPVHWKTGKSTIAPLLIRACAAAIGVREPFPLRVKIPGAVDRRFTSVDTDPTLKQVSARRDIRRHDEVDLVGGNVGDLAAHSGQQDLGAGQPVRVRRVPGRRRTQMRAKYGREAFRRDRHIPVHPGETDRLVPGQARNGSRRDGVALNEERNRLGVLNARQSAETVRDQVRAVSSGVPLHQRGTRVGGKLARALDGDRVADRAYRTIRRRG